MFEWFVEICNICVVVNRINLDHFWLDFLNVIQNTIDLKICAPIVICIWIKCLMFCEHIPIHFYTYQNQSFSNMHVP
jgi:hypothetical protein